MRGEGGSTKCKKTDITDLIQRQTYTARSHSLASHGVMKSYQIKQVSATEIDSSTAQGAAQAADRFLHASMQGGKSMLDVESMEGSGDHLHRRERASQNV